MIAWCQLPNDIPDSKVHGANIGTDRTQVGPMLATRTLLSGICNHLVDVVQFVDIPYCEGQTYND